MASSRYTGPVQLFNIGERIDDRYDIVDQLGSGGMAQVFRAHDRHLDREVALKVLRPHLTEADQERFRREIKALARLTHPGIVGIYDLGRSEHVYFAMELITGGLLTDLGPITNDLEPLTQFLDAAITVAETLAYVHHHGMVHRDLTPRNILLTDRGQPKVMDFGLVQLAEASRQLTRTGFTLGTPQYMAPEQAKGDPIGAHTDLYALGAVLYKTVTGTAPFEAENDQAILYQHVYADLQPAASLNPEVVPALSQLIGCLLSKDPSRRPGSGYLVAEALRTVRAQVERRSASRRQGGSGGTGVLPHGPTHPRSLARLWRTELPDGPQWPAAVTAAEGFLVLGLRNEQIHVLHPADGTKLTRFQADDEVNSPVSFNAGRLHYTSRGGAIYVLQWPSGRRAWEDLDAGANAITPYADGLLAATRQPASPGLQRRNAQGEVVWAYPTSADAVTSPLVHKGQACIMTLDGWLHCVAANSGEPRFKVNVGPIVAQPTARNNLLLLPERNGELHAFQMQTHEVLWTYDMEGELWSSPAAWDRYVFAASWAGVMRCLSLTTGDDVWEVDLRARVTASPLVASGVLYVVTEEGDVYALDARSGEQLFHDRPSPTPVQANPLVYQETLIVAALDGTVTAYTAA